jgi:hypothetical protein
MILAEKPRCQLHNRLSARTPWQWFKWLAGALRARVRLRTRLRRLRSGNPQQQAARSGAPSRFAAGTWVRVVDADRVFATLDEKKQLRGLPWLWQQWAYCGTVHRVFKPVGRMMDDSRRMRPVNGTVLLDTAPCGGPLGHHGCGRECPLMFRDEWLEEVPPPVEAAPAACEKGLHATVRSVEEIERTLDVRNSRGGLMLMPEMYGYAGKSFRVARKIERVWEGNCYVPVSQPVYMLEGLHCSGAILGADGPCERGCRLLWHADWLRLEQRHR